MSAPPFQKLFWGSYHKHTAHFRHAREHGAYLLLIGALWNHEGRLPADDESIAAYAMVELEEWLAMKPRIMPLMRIVRGKLTQPRVTEDLAKYRDISGKRKQAGKSGGSATRGKRKGNPKAIASDLAPYTEPESESSTLAKANAADAASDEDFDEDPLADLRALEPAKGAWRLALKVLMDRGGMAEARGRALVGKWAKLIPGQPEVMWEIAEAAWRIGTLDPIAYMGKAFEDRSRAAHGTGVLAPTDRQQRAWMQDWVEAPNSWRDHDRGPRPGEPGCRVSPEIQAEFAQQASEGVA